MNRNKYLILIIFLQFILSCDTKNNEKIQHTLSNKTQTEFTNSKQNINEYRTLEIDSLWKILRQKDGCLTGGQNIIHGKFGNQGCVLTNSKEWEAFFSKEKEELTLFLVDKFKSKDSTNTHTCPFFNATEGELAVYALQGIHNKNWFEFNEFRKYEQKLKSYSENEIRGNRDTYQGYLNDYILTDPKERKILEEIWLKEIK